MWTLVYVLGGWFVLSVIAAPIVGRLLRDRWEVPMCAVAAVMYLGCPWVN